MTLIDRPVIAETLTAPAALIAPRMPAWRRVAIWFAVPDRLTAASVFVVALALGTWNVTGSPTFQDDEGTYVAQAVAVQNGGLAPYTYWYDHPPFGWIQLAVLGWIPQALGLGAGSDLAAMRYVSAALFALTAMLVFTVARRANVWRPFAVLASAIFICSPLSLTLGRQVFLDTVGLPWILLAFWLALSPRRALWDHVGAGIAFAIGVLSKLTLAVMGPALLLAMIGRGTWRGRAFSIVGFLGVGALVLALYPVMAVLRGELVSGSDHVSLQDALTFQFLSRSGSGWIWEEGSSRHELLQGWMFLDTFLVLGGLLGAFVCVFASRTRWITAALVCFALPIVASQGYLPAMYIIGALPFLAIAIGAGAHVVWRGLHVFLRTHAPGARVGGPVLAVAVVASVVVLIPFGQWLARSAPLLAADENADWRSTLAWVDENVPREDTIVVPYSMWQDVDKLGWNDPWQAIVLEKIDLDSQFLTEHPRGWTELHWIVDGPTVAPNIDYLGLEEVRKAYDSSRVVATFGAWNVREVIIPTSPVVGSDLPEGDTE